ncbi:thiamine-phosphate kinase [Vineibacter terrae]|uniref:thiamine-phosphate kinase n=1 Tax=Vineibacter terrae TaxID=2586908 RepID=UPI002E37A4C9|nr:thiamine-phosphate kinase [Vineibacter terrae]HEX2892028.1 thiamine-phosphate kinase [Vineibacter terrae]
MAAARLGEFELIATLLRPLAAGFPGAFALGDDTARLAPPPGEELVVKTDALVCGVHFLPAHDPGLVARKALRVNLSDLAAAGARPLAYQLALVLPDAIDDVWLTAFCAGLADDQKTYGIALCGGDTTSTPGALTIVITAFGTAPAGATPGRGGARPGDGVFVSGTIGDGALGLLANTGRLPQASAADRAFLDDRYLLPQPRLDLGQRLRGVASACMDVSDGLVGDLGHICDRSGVRAVIDADAVPLSAAARAVLARRPDLLETVLSGGDDYELLFTAPAARAAAITEAAGLAGVPVVAIGRIEAGSGGVTVEQGGRRLALSRASYRHR